MTEQRVSLRYAKALFDTSKAAGNLDTIYKDLELIGNYISLSREFFTVLKSPVIKNWKKKELFKELFSSNVSDMTFNFLIILADKSREVLIPDIISVFENLYLTEKNIIKAEIITSRAIDEALKDKIIKELEKKISKTIIPVYKVDESLKGGIMFRIDNVVYDATVRNQLNRLKDTLIEGKIF